MPPKPDPRTPAKSLHFTGLERLELLGVFLLRVTALPSAPSSSCARRFFDEPLLVASVFVGVVDTEATPGEPSAAVLLVFGVFFFLLDVFVFLPSPVADVASSPATGVGVDGVSWAGAGVSFLDFLADFLVAVCGGTFGVSLSGVFAPVWDNAFRDALLGVFAFGGLSLDVFVAARDCVFGDFLLSVVIDAGDDASGDSLPDDFDVDCDGIFGDFLPADFDADFEGVSGDFLLDVSVSICAAVSDDFFFFAFFAELPSAFPGSTASDDFFFFTFLAELAPVFPRCFVSSAAVSASSLLATAMSLSVVVAMESPAAGRPAFPFFFVSCVYRT